MFNWRLNRPGCQTLAQINSWRALFAQPLLPWVFVHLQPYSGSGPCCLETLRSAQLVALALPTVGYATAIDLGDTTSPYGNVHYRDKQTTAQRVLAAAQALVYSTAQPAYPPPAFLTQTAYYNGSAARIEVQFDSDTTALQLLPEQNASCPSGIPAANCSGFVIIGSDNHLYDATAVLDTQTPTSATLVLTAILPPSVYGVGSAYGWAMWPLVRLYARGLPLLPWRQALTLPGPPPPNLTY